MASKNKQQHHNILIIDRKQDSSRQVAQTLKRHLNVRINVEKEEAFNSAIKELEQKPHKYKVILLDANMGTRFGQGQPPKGLQYLRHLKQKTKISAEVIIITGGTSDDVEWSQEFVKSGAFAFLNKLGSDTELATSVFEAIQKSDEHALMMRHRRRSNDILKWGQENDSIDELCEKTCELVVEIFECYHSGIVVFDFDIFYKLSLSESEDKGRLMYEYPLLYQVSPQVVKSNPLEREILDEKSPIWIDDIDENREKLNEIYEILDNQGFKALAIAPIIINDRVIASISIDMKKTHKYNMAKFLLLQDIAAKLGIAISYIHERKRSETFLELLKDTAHAKSLRDAYSVIVEKLQLYFQTSYCSIWLLNSEQSHVTIGAMYPMDMARPDEIVTRVDDWGADVIEGLGRGESFILNRDKASKKKSNGRQMMDKVKDLLNLPEQVRTTLIIPLRTSTNNILGNIELSSFHKESQIFPEASKYKEYANVLSPLIADTISVLMNKEIAENENELREKIDAHFSFDIIDNQTSDFHPYLKSIVTHINETFPDFEYLAIISSDDKKLELIAYDYYATEHDKSKSEEWFTTSSVQNELIKCFRSFEDSTELQTKQADEIRTVRHKGNINFSIVVPLNVKVSNSHLMLVATSKQPREKIEHLSMKTRMLQHIANKFRSTFETDRYITSKRHEEQLTNKLRAFTRYLNPATHDSRRSSPLRAEDDYFYWLALTAITSGQGIGINRAALYKYNAEDYDAAYECVYAIGHMTPQDTRRDWEQNTTENFEASNHESSRAPTPLYKVLTSKTLSQRAFKQLKIGERFTPATVTELKDEIGKEFLDLFYGHTEPIAQFVMVPLYIPSTSKDEIRFWGVLVGDNIGKNDVFEPHILTVLDTWVSTIMLTMKTRQLQERLENRQFATSKMSELMSKTRSSEMLEPAADIIRNYTQADFVIIYEYWERLKAFPPHVPGISGTLKDEDAIKQEEQPRTNSIVQEFINNPQEYEIYFKDSNETIAWIENTDDLIEIAPIVKREKHKSVIIVILRTMEDVGNRNIRQRVGVMFVNFRDRRNYYQLRERSMRQTFEQLINSVGEAIGKAQRLVRVQRHSNALEQIDMASGKLIEELSQEDRALSQTLQDFVQFIHILAEQDYQNWNENSESISSTNQRKPRFSSYICLYDDVTDILSFKAAYPEGRVRGAQQALERTKLHAIYIGNKKTSVRTASIVGHFFSDDFPDDWDVDDGVLNISNLQDSRYSSFDLKIDEGVRSLLVCVIEVSDKKYGIIAVESNMTNRFTKEFATNVKRFARNAAIAIHVNRLHIQEVRETQNNAMKRSVSIAHMLSNHFSMLSVLHDEVFDMLNEGDINNINQKLNELFEVVDVTRKYADEQLALFSEFTTHKTVQLLEAIIRDAIQEYETIYLIEFDNDTKSKEPSPKLILPNDTEPIYVKVDGFFIRLVFVNLFINAYQWTRPEEEVSIKIIVERVRDGRVKITVADQGVGMDAHTLEHIFEPGMANQSPRRKLQLYDNGNTETSTRIGIGLFTVRDILQYHGGNIECESEIGVGTTFYIDLPNHQISGD